MEKTSSYWISLRGRRLRRRGYAGPSGGKPALYSATVKPTKEHMSLVFPKCGDGREGARVGRAAQ